MTDLQPTKLGTQQQQVSHSKIILEQLLTCLYSWDEVYEEELLHWEEDGDEGEIWLGHICESSTFRSESFRQVRIPKYG